MKINSISSKMFIVFTFFTLGIFGVIGMGTKIFLPEYYLNHRMKAIEKNTHYIEENYNKMTVDDLVEQFEKLREEIGGDAYFMDVLGYAKGFGKGKNAKTPNFIPEGDVIKRNYTNRAGVEMYAFGVAVGEDYLIYEVSIQSLDDAVNIIMPFFLILLIISLLIAMGGAYFISFSLTKPIKQLNQLTKRMGNKEVITVKEQLRKDEIGQLYNSVMLMYEELLSNIQQLEREATKDRAIEKMKKQFLAQATHELKTPIAIIQGYAELLEEGIYKSDQEREEFIVSISSETHKMNQLIKDILDYSKMENGFYELHTVNTFINPWLNNIIKVFKGIMSAKNINFSMNNKVGDLCIEIDSKRMEQVIKNLISNAIEHSSGKINFNAFDMNGHLVMEVCNDGARITDEDIPFIFDSFYKKKGKKKGTGLGLAIVKGIVDLHRGEYRVENTETGVKFTIII